MSGWRTKLSNAYVFHEGLISVFPEGKNMPWTASTAPDLKDLPVKRTVSELFISITFSSKT